MTEKKFITDEDKNVEVHVGDILLNTKNNVLYIFTDVETDDDCFYNLVNLQTGIGIFGDTDIPVEMKKETYDSHNEILLDLKAALENKKFIKIKKIEFRY